MSALMCRQRNSFEAAAEGWSSVVSTQLQCRKITHANANAMSGGGSLTDLETDGN